MSTDKEVSSSSVEPIPPRRIDYAGSVHDEREIEAVLSVLRGGPTALRIGKHVGEMERLVAKMFGKRRVLDGDVENGSAPATYLPAEICASCVDQRMLGTVCPSLSVRVVGVIAPGRFSMSCSACSAQKPGRMHA